MTGPAIFGLIIWAMYLRFIVPVLGVFYGTSLMADEVEDKTITYLFTRPIPARRRAGRQVPGLSGLHGVRRPAVGGDGLSADRAAQGQPRGGVSGPAEGPAAARRSGWRSTGPCSRSSGAKFKRPLLIGLIFVFGWEQAALAFPGYLKQFTVMYYLQAIVPHAMPSEGVVSLIQGLFRETPSLLASLFWLAVIWAVSWPGGPDRGPEGIRARTVGVRLWALGLGLQANRRTHVRSLSLEPRALSPILGRSSHANCRQSPSVAELFTASPLYNPHQRATR